MTTRQKLVLTVIPSVFFLATVGFAVTGSNSTVTLVLLLVAALTMIGSELLGRRLNRRVPSPEPELTEAETAQLRTARDEEGTVAATARLRNRYPHLSLADAVRVVREL